MRWLGLLLLSAALVGCAALVGSDLDTRFGPADPARFDAPMYSTGAGQTSAIDYDREIKPLLDRRCVACHACYDAPCQLKLSSFEGLARGANPADPYAVRLLEAAPTRLFVDAQTNQEWRSKAFHPVLNERANNPQANREGSVMLRLLELKRQAPINRDALLPEKEFDLSLNREQQCPRVEQMGQFEAKHPHWGMPFGLPALSEAEHLLLTRWIEMGAPRSAPAPIAQAEQALLSQWEGFLNGDSLKARLMSRYVYEHWFAAHFYFDAPAHASTKPQPYELLRSATPPGQPIQLIATRRPYDDPGVERVYYRLRQHRDSIVSKTHLPLRLNPARMKKMQSWFLDPAFEVSSLPSYAPDVATNPFVAFRQLPIDGRYRFMLEDAQFILSGFMKGPVCRGQIALNVINDHFWVLFADPVLEAERLDEELLASSYETLRMPAEQENMGGLLRFKTYAEQERKYIRIKSDLMNRRFGKQSPLNLDMLWKGGSANNPNAALTALRHFDSATVLQGLVGERPQTVLVMGYPLFERIHYLLVSGFDIYGNVGHQLATRLYMDFLRMEGEFNFLAFLPRADRAEVHARWYRGASAAHVEQLQQMGQFFEQESGVQFKGTQPALEQVFAQLRRRFAPIDDARWQPESARLDAASIALLQQLSQVQGRAAALMPELSFLSVEDEQGQVQHFSLLRNSAHLNVATPFKEERTRVPEEDRLLLLRGFAGAYPNALLQVRGADIEAFVRGVQKARTESDYAALMTRFGVRRTSPAFWAHSDSLYQAYQRLAPNEAGLFDFSRLENR